METVEKCYCRKCNKELDETVSECGCGCRTFIFGALKRENGKFTCVCGCEEFSFTMHMDFVEKAVDNYKCNKCGNIIGTEYYRGDEEKWLWKE